MRRSPLRRQSRTRSGRETVPDAPRALREQLMVRADYRCEARFSKWCTGSFVPSGLHAHHRLRRQHGGPNTPENLVIVCADCHADIHAHPDRAYAAGLLIHRHDGPPTDAWDARNCRPGAIE